MRVGVDRQSHHRLRAVAEEENGDFNLLACGVIRTEAHVAMHVALGVFPRPAGTDRRVSP